ncbi:hypothetical protein Cgig2_028927 [Carnegiea gigantea]|uniref:Carboxypeptidase n=1 Tax=Carnegiea gigantea TaxID=171969 RepID=A0A9Q1QNL2_9CARY|nr:hypothetical protein Cgig2_028927 [Carnegiea gigantea]
MDQLVKRALVPLPYLVLPILLILFAAPIASCRPTLMSNSHQHHDQDKRVISMVNYEDDLVTSLPGQPNVNFRHYAGYVTVHESHERALFYWFFEASTQPEHKPLVLWLNGASDAYEFLHRWYVKFPAYRNRTFYIAGESYAGKYIPELAELIHDKNKDDPSLYIDLKGVLMGNPETSDPDDLRGMVDYAWSHAVVSDETYNIIKEKCDFNSSDVYSNPDCKQGLDDMLTQYNEIDIYSLYTSVCDANSTSSGSINSMLKTSPKMVSGWYQEYKGLTFATFRGAGHDVPTFKPRSSLALFASFLQGQSLPSSRLDT